MMDKYRFEIPDRAKAVVVGLQLRYFEFDLEVMGDVFPCPAGSPEEAKKEAYSDALAQAQQLLESRVHHRKRMILGYLYPQSKGFEFERSNKEILRVVPKNGKSQVFFEVWKDVEPLI
jgi:hypothetical protein